MKRRRKPTGRRRFQVVAESSDGLLTQLSAPVSYVEAQAIHDELRALSPLPVDQQGRRLTIVVLQDWTAPPKQQGLFHP